jgi:nitric oxide reductase subunit B
MVVFTFYMVWKGGRDHPNKAALLWCLGCAVMAFFGAGVWGFMHTLSGINYYTHGTQVTAAHGHMAFYGAYVMVNIAIMAYAIPNITGKPLRQMMNMWGFWITTSAISFMTFVLTFAGSVQTHLQRVLGENFMDVQDQLGLFYMMRLGSGVFVVLGAVIIVASLLLPGKDKEA